MTNSMEIAKGIAKIKTGTTYNVVGEVVGSVLEDNSQPHVGENSQPKPLSSHPDYENPNSESSFFPGERYEGDAKEMPDGCIAWTTPWAIKHDEEKGSFWLKPDLGVMENKGGTVTINLARTDGYYFISNEDVQKYGHEFTKHDEELLIREGHIRLYPSDSEIDINAIKEMEEIIRQLKEM